MVQGKLLFRYFLFGLFLCITLLIRFPYWSAWLITVLIAFIAEVVLSTMRPVFFRGETVIWVIIGATLPLYWIILVG